jgi:hypothetical protein
MPVEPAPLDRLFAELRAEYGRRVAPEILDRTLRHARQHAEYLSMEHRPDMVGRAVREILDDHVPADRDAEQTI